MPSLSRRLCEEILAYVRQAEAAPDQPLMPQPARWISALEHALRAKRSAGSARRRRERKRHGRRERTASVRAAVMERAAGRCEAAVAAILVDGAGAIGPCGGGLELDHQEGGVGRRTQRESVETCWAICSQHHGLRTRNRPSSNLWWRLIAAHRKAHGYEAEAVLADRRLPAEVA